MPILETRFPIRRRKNKIDARRGRRVRTRLTRVLALALAGPLMAGSLAYAAGVEPVRRRVDEFLKGTAGLFRKAESSSRNFHLSPNPSGQGVLVMPVDDRGPRAPADPSTQESGNAKEESAPSDESKKRSEGSGGNAKKHTADSTVGDPEESTTKSDDSKETSSGSVSDAGSGDTSQESSVQEADGSGPDDDSHEGSGDSDGDRSGSDSGSNGSDDDRSGSDSGQSDSVSDNG